MRSEGVVLLPPLLDEYPGLLEVAGDLAVKEFISQLAVEGFIVAVLPGAARLNEQNLNPTIGQPLPGCTWP